MTEVGRVSIQEVVGKGTQGVLGAPRPTPRHTRRPRRNHVIESTVATSRRYPLGKPVRAASERVVGRPLEAHLSAPLERSA